VGANLADKVEGEDDDEGEELPPVDFEKLAQYGSGEAEPTLAEQMEKGTFATTLYQRGALTWSRTGRDRPTLSGRSSASAIKNRLAPGHSRHHNTPWEAVY
jgi:hypothetical protein